MTITAAMMVAEIVAGLLTNSLALLSDAGHMLTHLLALGVSYLAIWLANREADPSRTYGWYRVEILAALFNAVTLAAFSVGIGVEAMTRFGAPPPVDTGPMIWVAIAGLVVNLVTAFILHGASRHDLNVRSAFLHLLGDTASSVVVVGGGALMYYTGWFVVDPILSVLVALVIALWSVGLLRESVHVLMEAAPRHLGVEDVEAAIRECAPEVHAVTDLHIWEITSQMYALSAHLELSDAAELGQGPSLVARVGCMLDERYRIGHATLQLDVAD